MPRTGRPKAEFGGWSNYDEYGNATNATADTGIVNYGWLGGKQRAVSGAGLTLMGVRLYNPVTGLFTSTDLVEGGNANAYTYPSDPINSFDTDGKRRYYEEDETPKRLRFKSWYNGFGSTLTRMIYFPNCPYKDAPRKYARRRSRRRQSGGPERSIGRSLDVGAYGASKVALERPLPATVSAARRSAPGKGPTNGSAGKRGSS